MPFPPLLSPWLNILFVFGLTSDDSSGSAATQAEKEEVDSRSIYVGNVRFPDHCLCCVFYMIHKLISK